MIVRAAAAAFLGVVAAAPAQDQAAGQVLSGLSVVSQGVKGTQSSKLKLAGLHAFKEDEVRQAIGEHVREIDEKGVSPARADDAAPV